MLTIMMTSAFAQERGGGLFGKGATRTNDSDESYGPMIPKLGENKDQTEVPLGSGLLLIGFGTAYALMRKDKKD